jgi:uncharacterized protein (DUF433 family)
MSLSETRYEHIVLDETGAAWIGETTMKVVELVVTRAAYGWSPEELAFQYPHLTLGQIYSALAYYWDHRDELDRDIARRLARVDALKNSTPPTRLSERLKARGMTGKPRANSGVSLETYRIADEWMRIANRAVRRAQEESRAVGVPNVYSIGGVLYYELPNGELSRQDPYVERNTGEDSTLP